MYFFCVSKLLIDLFFKLPVNRYLAINIEGKIGQLTVRRTSSFTNKGEHSIIIIIKQCKEKMWNYFVKLVRKRIKHR
jgi:hypothetical protein